MTGIDRELVELIIEKRVIPFIGAGFSKTCGFPSWKQLIEQLLKKFNVDLNGINDKTDFHRIAEYLKIKNGGSIGPLRLEMQKVFDEEKVDISKSLAHMYLASLKAPIIYTTNYDSLIEKTYENLKIPYTKVVTTRDIVKAANCRKTQIVKFHGSFEYEDTILLTESDYFRRLEFETPIDIKLRADVLGKSILFMGYSFHDFDIRFMWFKLQKMMKDISAEELPRSFILLTEYDPMIETLFLNMGITPIDISKIRKNTLTEKLCEYLRRLVVTVQKGERQ